MACNRANGEGEKEQELTASAEGVETGSGKDLSWRGDEVDLVIGRLKTSPVRTFGGFSRGVDR